MYTKYSITQSKSPNTVIVTPDTRQIRSYTSTQGNRHTTTKHCVVSERSHWNLPIASLGDCALPAVDNTSLDVHSRVWERGFYQVSRSLRTPLFQSTCLDGDGVARWHLEPNRPLGSLFRGQALVVHGDFVDPPGEILVKFDLQWWC